jgi:hypothetical protein
MRKILITYEIPFQRVRGAWFNVKQLEPADLMHPNPKWAGLVERVTIQIVDERPDGIRQDEKGPDEIR